MLLGAAGLFALGQEHLWEDEEADSFEKHTPGSGATEVVVLRPGASSAR